MGGFAWPTKVTVPDYGVLPHARDDHVLVILVHIIFILLVLLVDIHTGFLTLTNLQNLGRDEGRPSLVVTGFRFRHVDPVQHAVGL